MHTFLIGYSLQCIYKLIKSNLTVYMEYLEIPHLEGCKCRMSSFKEMAMSHVPMIISDVLVFVTKVTMSTFKKSPCLF